jgi:hypothetical protein
VHGRHATTNPPPNDEGEAMCLNCGCMRAHDDMGKPDVNITYETVKRAAEANDQTIEETLDTIARTADKDRADHPAEYAANAPG